MNSSAPGQSAQRIIAVDALRGLVMLVLVPDLHGGFSFYEMAERYPDSALWRWLGREFSHVPWSGAAIWDFVMPVFIFLVGVAIPLSYHNRIARGDSHGQLLTHALVRAFALVLLGLLIQFKPQTRVDQLLPYLVLSLGLPLSAWAGRLLGIEGAQARLGLQRAWWVLVLGFVSVWLVWHYPQLREYNFNQILTQIGLAYVAAFLLVRKSPAVQFAAAALILALYGLAFALYSPAPALKPTGEIFTGWFAHWNNGDNLAAAFDLWFLNLLPRAQPYTGNSHGYHTIEFVALISVMLAGMMVGRRMYGVNDKHAVARRLIVAATIAIAFGWLLSLILFPLVKSLYTPSWTVFSTGVALLLLALLYFVCDASGYRLWALPLTVLGTNSVLLYVLAATERWRVVSLWQKLVDADWLAAQPLVESLLVLLFFWLLAFALYRTRLFIRL